MPEQHPQPPGPPKPARRWKRTAVAVMLLLLGGAIVNVAVAWGCAWWVFDLDEVDARAVATAYDDDGSVIESWTAYRWHGLGSTMVISDRWRSKQNDVVFHPHPADLLPAWSAFREPRQAFADGTKDEDYRTAMLRGWPSRSLACMVSSDVESEFADAPYRVSLVIKAGYPSATALEPRLLPLRPILPGFIINTLFYALLLWLLFFAPFAAGRMLRRRRGQCEKCAYPIGVSPVCTECGAAVSRKVEA